MPHYERAWVLADHQRHEEAIVEVQLHLASHPDDPFAIVLLAKCLRQLKRFDEAETQAKHAIHLAPDEAMGYVALGSVLNFRNRLEEAAGLYAAALQKDSENANLHALKGSILVQLDRWPETLQAAQAGLAIDPEDADCLYLEAYSQMMMGNWTQAKQSLQRALKLHPEDARPYITQGWMFIFHGQTEAAIASFQEALRLDPHSEGARNGMAEALKTRNFFYRCLVKYGNWVARLQQRHSSWIRVVLTILLGLCLVPVFARMLNDSTLTGFATPALCFFIWVALLLAQVLPACLKFDRVGRHTVNPDQWHGAIAVGSLLCVGMAALIAFLVTGARPFLAAAVVFTFLGFPTWLAFPCPAGWPRRTLLATTVAVALLSLPLLTPVSLLQDGNRIWNAAYVIAGWVFPVGFIATLVLANFLFVVQVRK